MALARTIRIFDPRLKAAHSADWEKAFGVMELLTRDGSGNTELATRILGPREHLVRDSGTPSSCSVLSSRLPPCQRRAWWRPLLCHFGERATEWRLDRTPSSISVKSL